MKKIVCAIIFIVNALFIISFLAVVGGGNSRFIAEHSINQSVIFLLFLVLNLIFLSLQAAFIDGRFEYEDRFKVVASGIVSLIFLLIFLIGEYPMNTADEGILIVIVVMGLYTFGVSTSYLIPRETHKNTFSNK